MSLRSSTGRSNDASVSRFPGAKAKRASPIGEPFWSSPRTTPARNVAIGAQHLHRHLGCRIFGSGKRQRRRRAAFKYRERAIADNLAQALEEFRAAPAVDAIRQPCDLAIAGRFQEAVDDRQGFRPDRSNRVLAQVGVTRPALCRPA